MGYNWIIFLAKWPKTLGLNTTEAINLFYRQVKLFYRQVKLFRGLPFEVRIPNEETRKVLQESNQGKNLVPYDSLDDVFEDLGI